MMQSFLAQRFSLQLHFEQKEMPVLGMTLVKLGKPGPKLRPHSEGPACDQKGKPGMFPESCYTYEATDTGKGLVLSAPEPLPCL